MNKISRFIFFIYILLGLAACASYVPIDKNQGIGVLVSYAQKTNPPVNRLIADGIKQNLQKQGFTKVVIVPTPSQQNAQRYFQAGSLTTEGKAALNQLSTKYRMRLLVAVTDDQSLNIVEGTSQLLPSNYHVDLRSVNKRVETSYRIYFIRLPEDTVITERPGKLSVLVSQYDWGRAVINQNQAKQLAQSLNQYLISSIMGDLKRFLIT